MSLYITNVHIVIGVRRKEYSGFSIALKRNKPGGGVSAKPPDTIISYDECGHRLAISINGG